MNAPIVLFVYNRPKHTRQTLEALSKNRGAAESELIIYADGPKSDASVDDVAKIQEVRAIIKERNWCKHVTIIESSINKGLADSIIEGVTATVNDFGKVIVLEDDIECSAGFLQYMNDALVVYENDEKVMHISGFMYPYTNSLPETFFYQFPSPWGWATWKRAWKYYNNNTDFLYHYFEKNNRWNEFNTVGGVFLQNQLEQNKKGELKTWFIKWHASILIHEGLTLFPNRSLTKNNGFDGSGVHFENSTKYIGTIVDTISVKKQKIQSSNKAGKIFVVFYETLYGGAKISYIMNTLATIREMIVKPMRKIILKWKRIKEIISQLKYLNRLESLPDEVTSKQFIEGMHYESVFGESVLLNDPYTIVKTTIGSYSYVSVNATISETIIGKFCSIGPNFLCGWGIHPTSGISTSPMFYSTLKQNGTTLSETNKIEERKTIIIGNDVFIGANVTILDGVTIGDGAIIGAGAIVSKDIPPYAIAVGNPISVVRYRFNQREIDALLKICWWDFSSEKLQDVEKMFFSIDSFIEKYKS